MAIAFDASSRSGGTGATTDPLSWTHTPSGTPKGVVVCVGQNGSGDTVNAVTYGGVAMSRVRHDNRTTTEAMATFVYFLGASVPTGAQTVSVDMTGTANTRGGVAVSVTATEAETAVDVHNGADAGIIANPSLTLNYSDSLAAWSGVYVLSTGLNAPVTTAEAGCTDRQNIDNGSTSMMVCTKDGTGGTTTTMGYTAASDDACHSGVILKEQAVVPVPQIVVVMAPMVAP